MVHELKMKRSEIDEALRRCLHNNEMACYLMLAARHCGIYNNRLLVAEVIPLSLNITLFIIDTNIFSCVFVLLIRLSNFL